MSVVKVTFQELRTTASQLNTTAAQIDSESNKAKNKVDALVGAGWEGAASKEFDLLMAEWQKGAKQVHEALTKIGDLLEKASNAYEDTENQIKGSMR